MLWTVFELVRFLRYKIIYTQILRQP